MNFRARHLVISIIFILFLAFLFTNIYLFKDFFWVQKEKNTQIISDKASKCELILDKKILIPRSEFVSMSENLENWEISVSDQKVAKIEGNKILALDKGETEIVFKNKLNKDCVKNINLTVVNFMQKSQLGTGRI